MKPSKNYSQWLMFFVLSLLSCLYLAWLLLLKANFFYSINYALLDIDATIEQYAPLNVYRKGFAGTTQDERFRLFAGIVNSIANRGRGLEDLHYHRENGAVIDSLLTEAEIIHLNDVARLVTVVDLLGTAAIAIFGVLLLVFYHQQKRRPSLVKIHLLGVVFFTLLIGLILQIGATKVFYAAHTWIFPSEHQWFFYYEQSLMTTLMKAPDLFGLIAIELLAIALLFYGLVLFCAARYFKSFCA